MIGICFFDCFVGGSSFSFLLISVTEYIIVELLLNYVVTYRCVGSRVMQFFIIDSVTPRDAII